MMKRIDAIAHSLADQNSHINIAVRLPTSLTELTLSVNFADALVGLLASQFPNDIRRSSIKEYLDKPSNAFDFDESIGRFDIRYGGSDYCDGDVAAVCDEDFSLVGPLAKVDWTDLKFDWDMFSVCDE